jgi:outer membrane protein assembly factor BamB
MLKSMIVVSLLGSVTFANAVQALDWAQWRGPNRDGISDETGLLQSWPSEGPPLLWQADGLGDGYSSPAVVGDRFYLLGSEGLDNEFVQARSTADGSKIWIQKIGKVGNPDQRPPYPGARSTPTVDGDRVYALGSDGDLVCLSADSGNIVWQKNVRTEFGGLPGEWAYSESPLIDGDAVVVTPGGPEATLLKLNKATGEVIWKAPLEGGEEAAYSSIVPATLAGHRQYVQFLQKGVVGVNAESGELLWRYDRTAKGSLANIPTPVVHGDMVYTAAGKAGGAVVKIVADGDGLAAEELYFDGKLPRAIGGSVLVGDHLYGTASDSLMCVELATGEVVWRDRALGAASICVADGCLYLHGENGDVALVKATPEKYELLGRFTPPNPPEAGSSKSWAYPVIADGRLYIFNFGTMWCFDVKAE